jgi:hypothetical protein
MSNRMKLEDYLKWAARVVLEDHTPGDLVRLWAMQWGRTLAAMNAAHGYFEILSITFARWEFFGGLYEGVTGDSDHRQASAYCRRFVEPIQPRYGDLHDVAERGGNHPTKPDFISMFRDNPFHGMSLIPCMGRDEGHLVGWLVGTAGGIPPERHLVIDATGNININCGLVVLEMLASMQSFARYLDENTDRLDERVPGARLQRAFWARQRPVHFRGEPDIWMKKGYSRGVPI